MLAAATVVMIAFSFWGACKLRGKWPHSSRRPKLALVLVASFLVIVYSFGLFTGWAFTSPWVNEVLGAITIGGYAFLVLLITLLRPKVLAYSFTTFLLLPVLIALIWLPLSAPGSVPPQVQHISGTLFARAVHWDAGAMGSSGTTFLIYDRPRIVPFAEHRLQKVFFNDAKCLSDKAFFVLQADGRHVLARCPWPEYQHKEGFHDFLIPVF